MTAFAGARIDRNLIPHVLSRSTGSRFGEDRAGGKAADDRHGSQRTIRSGPSGGGEPGDGDATLPPMRTLRFIWEHPIETLRSWLRHPIESFRVARGEDQIAFQGLEYDEKTGKLTLKP